MKTRLFLIVLTFFSIDVFAIPSPNGKTVEVNKGQASQESLENLQPYPLPSANEKRVVIHLPADATAGEVEILVGRLALVDSCNDHGFVDSSIKDVGLEGYGYSLYQAQVGNMMMTSLVACPTLETHLAFVPGASIRARYNTKLPIVVYSKPDVLVEYRIWKPTSYKKTE